MSMYLDFNATTPVLPEVAELVCKLMLEEYGNAGSRTHEFGVAAKRFVENARLQVASLVNADKTEVIFTSGATESNNIAIQGLRDFAKKNNKKHIITSKIEHKAVLEPIEYLESQGFEVTYLNVTASGQVDVLELKKAIREDTFLVSIMHINNETGAIQPLREICQVLMEHDAYLHVDAAQSFGKYSNELEDKRIDFISVSGHKIYAPKGVGALIMRRRGFAKPPLSPIYFGGGQEKGLRPGTLATPLIAGFGLACEIASKNSTDWYAHVHAIKKEFLARLQHLNIQVNGSETSPYVLNFSIPGINSEAAMVKLKGIVAVSNGSACTSNSYTASHVLSAMGLEPERIAGALRVSFGIQTRDIPFDDIIEALASLL